MRKEYIDSISKAFEDSYDTLIEKLYSNVSDHKKVKEIVDRLDVTIEWARNLSTAETYNFVIEGLKDE